MFKRLMVAALAALGTSMAFGSIHGAAAMVTAKPMPISPTKELKITEILVNPQGTDNANEYIEIKNTSLSSMDLENVYLVYIDGEADQDGEIDAFVRLGNDGSGGIGGSGARSLAAGATLVIRDKNGSNPRATISPEGGTVIEVEFNSVTGIGDSFRNSLGMFALVTGVSSAPSAGTNLDTETWSGGVKTSNDPNGILDFTENTASDDIWTTTLDVVDLKRASNESGSEYYYSLSDIPGTEGTDYDAIRVDQKTTWTPDGFSRMFNSTYGWTNGVVYDTNAKNGSNEFTFVTASEYSWMKSNGSLSTSSGNTRCSPGLCDGSQLVVTNGTDSWAH